MYTEGMNKEFCGKWHAPEKESRRRLTDRPFRETAYLRTVEIDGSTGSVEVMHLPQRQSLSVTIRFPHVQSLPAIVMQVRRLFDLGADIETIDGHLSRDPLLAPLENRGGHWSKSRNHHNSPTATGK